MILMLRLPRGALSLFRKIMITENLTRGIGISIIPVATVITTTARQACYAHHLTQEQNARTRAAKNDLNPEERIVPERRNVPVQRHRTLVQGGKKSIHSSTVAGRRRRPPELQRMVLTSCLSHHKECIEPQTLQNVVAIVARIR